MESTSHPVVMVTGGSRGIGAAVSRALVGSGAEVAVNYRSDTEAAAELARTLGARASIWQADVTDPAAASGLVDSVIERHGRLDGVVLNAGVWHGGRIGEVSERRRHEVMATAVDSAFHLLPAVLPHLRESIGRIVVVSSVIGLIGYPGDSVYGAAKAAQIGLVRSLAKEVGPDRILVNAVAPGLVETDMTAAVSERAREQMLQRAALRRIGQPDEVARAIRFLVLEAEYLTGQVLVVDGGLGL